MKYSNCQLVDSENPRILEIEDSDFSKIWYRESIHKFFKELGFNNARGSGNTGWRNDIRNFSIKLSANQYFRFNICKNSVDGCYSIDTTSFATITKQTSSGVGPKGRKYFLNTITFDGDKFVEYIKTQQEQKKEKKQNKTISKFRKDIILPWVTGNIQEVIPEFSQCSFGNGNIVYGSYSNKNITFRFNSVRMTQKQISEIDFDDITFNIYLNIKNMTQSFDKELKVKMSGIKNLVSNFPEIEKEYRIRQLETEKEIRPVQDVVNSLYKEKKIVCDKIEKEKGTIESIREKSKNNFAKFLNELNLGKEN
jgi:hypothetical protein